MNGINVLMKETQRAPLPLPSGEDTLRSQQLGRGPLLTVLAPDLSLPVSRTKRRKYLWFIGHPIYGIFALVAPTD